MEEIRKILKRGDPQELLALFTFDKDTKDDKVLLKYRIWAAYFFPQFFPSKSADFHRDIDKNNLSVYRGYKKYFLNIVFRGGAKTTRTKVWRAFVIANDKDHSRRFCKVLAKDTANSKQVVTDVYNMLISPRVLALYPEIFEKTDAKREETMGSFTTATGIKLTAGTVGTDQRGQIQDEARPDEVWFDDFETRDSLRSAVKTKAIWDNMEEARTGLSKDGGVVYTCNYVSERGNVHKLFVKAINNENWTKLVVPIIESGVPTWNIYSVEDVEQIKRDADDFEGEYLCQPSAGKDVFFDRETLENQETKDHIKSIAGFRIYKEYNASHRYAGGADISGGVGLDSSTTVIIDFTPVPAQVVATFNTNIIKPDDYGDEMARQGERYGECLLAPEQNNHGHATIGRLKQIYPIDKLHVTQRKDTKKDDSIRGTEYGWHTNALTKPKMLFSFSKAIEDGLIELNDPQLKAEALAFTRDDMMDKEVDPRLTTRHFDLLMAACIAWQMKDFAEVKKEYEYDINKYENNENLHDDIGV